MSLQSMTLNEQPDESAASDGYQIHTNHADLDNLLADDDDYDDSDNDNNGNVHADGNSVLASADIDGLYGERNLYFTFLDDGAVIPVWPPPDTENVQASLVKQVDFSCFDHPMDMDAINENEEQWKKENEKQHELSIPRNMSHFSTGNPLEEFSFVANPSAAAVFNRSPLRDVSLGENMHMTGHTNTSIWSSQSSRHSFPRSSQASAPDERHASMATLYSQTEDDMSSVFETAPTAHPAVHVDTGYVSPTKKHTPSGNSKGTAVVSTPLVAGGASKARTLRMEDVPRMRVMPPASSSSEDSSFVSELSSIVGPTRAVHRDRTLVARAPSERPKSTLATTLQNAATNLPDESRAGTSMSLPAASNVGTTTMASGTDDAVSSSLLADKTSISFGCVTLNKSHVSRINLKSAIRLSLRLSVNIVAGSNDVKLQPNVGVALSTTIGGQHALSMSSKHRHLFTFELEPHEALQLNIVFTPVECVRYRATLKLIVMHTSETFKVQIDGSTCTYVIAMQIPLTGFGGCARLGYRLDSAPATQTHTMDYAMMTSTREHPIHVPLPCARPMPPPFAGGTRLHLKNAGVRAAYVVVNVYSDAAWTQREPRITITPDSFVLQAQACATLDVRVNTALDRPTHAGVYAHVRLRWGEEVVRRRARKFVHKYEHARARGELARLVKSMAPFDGEAAVAMDSGDLSSVTKSDRQILLSSERCVPMVVCTRAAYDTHEMSTV